MKTTLHLIMGCVLIIILSSKSSAQYIPEQMFTIDSLILHQDMLNNHVRSVSWNNKVADYNKNGQIMLLSGFKKTNNNQYFDTLQFYYSGSMLNQQHYILYTCFKNEVIAKYSADTRYSLSNGLRTEIFTSVYTSYFKSNISLSDSIKTEQTEYSKFNYTITKMQTSGNRDTLHYHKIFEDSVITDVLNHTTLLFHFESKPTNDSLQLQYTKFCQFGASGKVISEKSGSHNINYTYDSLSRLIKIVETDFSFDTLKRIYVQPNIVRSVDYSYFGEGLVQEQHYTCDYDRKMLFPYYTVDWEFQYNKNGLIHSVQKKYRRNPSMSDDFYRNEDVPDADLDNDHSKQRVKVRYTYY